MFTGIITDVGTIEEVVDLQAPLATLAEPVDELLIALGEVHAVESPGLPLVQSRENADLFPCLGHASPPPFAPNSAASLETTVKIVVPTSGSLLRISVSARAARRRESGGPWHAGAGGQGQRLGDRSVPGRRPEGRLTTPERSLWLV